MRYNKVIKCIYLTPCNKFEIKKSMKLKMNLVIEVIYNKNA